MCDKKRTKIALITGATSGFGRIYATMADEKFKSIEEYWLVGRNVGNLMDLSEEMKHRVKLIPYDLSSMESLRKIKAMLKEEKPVIKILVNAAGFGETGLVENQDEETLASMIEVNCRALTYLSRICIPYMKKNSRIINFASVAAFMPQPSFAVYAATKSYVLSFTRALNCELRKKKIYALAVCPGPARTCFFEHAEKNVSAGFYKNWFMVDPEPVVAKAMKDSILKKEFSVYSFPMKLLHLITKILPQKIIFWFL